MYNLCNSREQRINHCHRPLFECLAEYRVIRISKGSAYNLPRIVPAETLLVHEYTHELGNGYGRMSVVYMNLNIVRQIKHRQMLLLML